MLPFKAATTLTLQQFASYYPLPIHSELLTEPICYRTRIVKISYVTTTYHNRYMIPWKLISTECEEESNKADSEMLQKISKFPTLNSYSVYQLKRTGVTKLLDWWLDMIRMYSLTLDLINLRRGYCTTHQPFHYPICIERLELDWKVEYTNANLVIMSESDYIWVQYMDCAENDHNNTFQG